MQAGDAVSADRRPEWQHAYQAALLEMDPAKLCDRIMHAYAAMQAYRDDALKNKADIDHESLSDALSNLRGLNAKLGLPANDPDEEKGPETLAPDH